MNSTEQTQFLERYAARLGFVTRITEQSPAPVNSFNEKVDQLHSLKCLVEKHPLSLSFQKKNPIVIELSWLPPSEQVYWKARLSRHYNQCGCGHGAAFLLMGIILLLLDLFFNGNHQLGMKYLLVAALFLFLFSATGKVIGIIWHRAQFHRVVSRLSRESIATPLNKQEETNGNTFTH